MHERREESDSPHVRRICESGIFFAVTLSLPLRATVLGLGIYGGWLGQAAQSGQSDRVLREPEPAGAGSDGTIRLDHRTGGRRAGGGWGFLPPPRSGTHT